MAKLYFRYGTMNCGKTTQLLQVAHNYEERDMNVLIFKPEIDTKGGNKIVSRLGVERKVDYLISKDDNIFTVVESYLLFQTIDCILVDEVQFLTPRQIEQLHVVAHTVNIPVICYGLRTDFRGFGFEGSNRLLQLADEIEELKTICDCGKKATMHIRKVNGEIIFDGEQVCIDDKANIEYISVCANCFYKELKKYLDNL